jgi:hypothetical protein
VNRRLLIVTPIAAVLLVALLAGWLTFRPEPRHQPGIADRFTINSAIALPIGMEAYAAYALRVWLAGVGRTQRTRSRVGMTNRPPLDPACTGEQGAFRARHEQIRSKC